MPERLTCGVVGVGHIGMRHARLLNEHPDYQLTAVCDIAEDKLHSFGETARYTDYARMLAGEELDVVSVCVPNHLHVPYAEQAIQAGSHVICEKPLGLGKAACEALVKLANARSRKLFCVLQNRYSPTVQWLDKICREERLGEIFQVQVNCFWNRDDRYYFVQDEKGDRKPHPWHGSLERDGGPLFTQFSHFVDILIALFGPLAVQDARFFDFNHAHSTEFEDSGIVQLETQNGVHIRLSYSTSVWGRNAESSIFIMGGKGTVKVGGQYMNHVDYCHIRDYEMPALPETRAPNHYGGYTGSAGNHGLVFQNVADVLLRDAHPDFPIQEAVHGVEVIEQIYRLRHLV